MEAIYGGPTMPGKKRLSPPLGRTGKKKARLGSGLS
jgi:hypothetical protein